MTKTADAVIIGAGVIGTAIALELNRVGFRTISIDKNRAAGHGPTSGSCAIIRVHYSTLDGTAFAFEGYHYWRDWAEYLEANDPRGMAQFRETGCLVMRTELNGHLNKHVSICDDLGIPYEEWDARAIVDRLPIYDLQSYSPAKRMDDPDFGKSNGRRIEGAIYWPTARLCHGSRSFCTESATCGRATRWEVCFRSHGDRHSPEIGKGERCGT